MSPAEWTERKTLYRAGVRFPDPRDEDLQVRSIVLLWRQMVARRVLCKRLHKCASSRRAVPNLALVR